MFHCNGSSLTFASFCFGSLFSFVKTQKPQIGINVKSLDGMRERDARFVYIEHKRKMHYQFCFLFPVHFANVVNLKSFFLFTFNSLFFRCNVNSDFVFICIQYEFTKTFHIYSISK